MDVTPILDALNDAQREAVTGEQVPMLVLAGAGSGGGGQLMARPSRRRRRSISMVPSTMAMMDVIFILFAVFLSVSQIRKSTVKVNLPEVSDAVATGENLKEIYEFIPLFEARAVDVVEVGGGAG